jgi:hypothetical protein
MRIRNSSLGTLAAALLASTAMVAHAEPVTKRQLQLAAVLVAEEFPADIDFVLDGALPALELNNGWGANTTIAALAVTPVTKTTISRSEAQSAIARAIKSGYSLSSEPDQLPAELNRSYVVSDHLSAALRTGFSTPIGDEMTFAAAAAETQLKLGRITPAISWSWHTGVDMTLQSSGANAIESGPQFKMGGGPIALTLTPKVAQSFGAHHEFAFAYAAGLKSELAKGVAIGIEAFGATADVAVAPGTALQSQRTNSGLYVGLDLAQQPKGDVGKLSLELGALADMSESKPDWAGKIKAVLSW